jgi:hypothetical protein
MNNFLQSVKKFFIKIGFTLLGIALLVTLYFSFFHYSEGNRAGTVIKISKKGYLLKTWEGELNLGMVITDNGGAAVGAQNNIWEFSIDNKDELINKLVDANKTGKRVQLKYKELYFKLPWEGDTKYIVTDIQTTGITDTIIH